MRTEDLIRWLWYIPPLLLSTAIFFGCGARVSFECPLGSLPGESGCAFPSGSGSSGGLGGGSISGNGGMGGMGGSGGGAGGSECTDPKTSSWFIATGPSDSLIALCGGKVLIGNQSKNRIEIIEIKTNILTQSWQLDASPGDIVFDPESNTIYVTLLVANRIAKINLDSPDVQIIVTAAPVLRLALGNDGIVFATHDFVNGLPDRPITIIDGPSATVKTIAPGRFDRLVAFDRTSNQLFAATYQISAAELTRFAFDPLALTLTKVQYNGNAGDSGNDLKISPDGLHVAFVGGDVNGSGAAILDYDANDLNTTFGAWMAPPVPTAAAFTADGTKLVASSRDDLFVFDTKTHVLLDSLTPMSPGGCGYQFIDHVAVSPAGGIFYGISKCGFDKKSGMLYWFGP
jgi:DNA-binding beta-propeller fold protein YncE